MIKCNQFLIVYDSFTMQVINPECLELSREQIEAYISDHPFPYDPAYSEKDFIDDITMRTGIYYLPNDTSEETQKYICECLNTLL